MLASQCWHTENHFRLLASHRAMPSLCPLPSAVSTGGEAILLPWEVRLRKRGSTVVLLSAGLGFKNRFLVPRPPSWHLGIPGARNRHPLSFSAREWGWIGGCEQGYRESLQPLAVPQEITSGAYYTLDWEEHSWQDVYYFWSDVLIVKSQKRNFEPRFRRKIPLYFLQCQLLSDCVNDLNDWKITCLREDTKLRTYFK